MAIEFDPAKDATNLAKHGLALGDFSGFDTQPIVVEDLRSDFGEQRYRAYGRIEELAHCVVFTIREGNMRLIGFRRAHGKELRRYEQ